MANEKRLIDANALSELLDVEYRRKMVLVKKGENHLDTLAEGIMSTAILLGTMPTVDSVEVVHGRWDEIPNKYMSVSTKTGSYSGHATSCSVCHEVNPNAFKTNYCPNCGAKMDGDGNG